MRILIQNYSTINSNEPIYLNNGINNLNNKFVSAVWSNNQQSVFDTFDRYQPNILVCHAGLITNDLVKYLSLNKEKDIKLIVNISGLNSNLKEIEDKFEQMNIKPLFMYSNEYSSLETKKPEKNKFVRLLPAANIDEIDLNGPKYKIDTAILAVENSEKLNKVCGEKTVYHKIKIGNEPDPNFDFHVNCSTMFPLYNNYKSLILVGKVKDVCGQIFFDSLLKSQNMSLKIEDEENFPKFLEEVFDEQEVDDENVLKILREQIRSNHTSKQRVEQFIKEIEACL
jgi:hypothetical protein